MTVADGLRMMTLADTQSLREELQQELDAVNESIVWLRAELRVVTTPRPQPSTPSPSWAMVCGLSAAAVGAASAAIWVLA